MDGPSVDPSRRRDDGMRKEREAIKLPEHSGKIAWLNSGESKNHRQNGILIWSVYHVYVFL